LEWVTGPKGGWYAINEGFSRFVAKKNPSIDIRVVPGGGKDNPTCVEEGKSHFGSSIDFMSAAAYRGLSPYVKPNLKLMTIGAGRYSGNADKCTESQRLTHPACFNRPSTYRRQTITHRKEYGRI
jgi:hypothetical protein